MPGRRLGIQTHMGMAVARPAAIGTIPGPQGTLLVSFDASQQSVGNGVLGEGAGGGTDDNGPVNMWEDRSDTVHGTPDDAGTVHGTWSIISTSIGNALQASLPVDTRLRRVDLENGHNTGTGRTFTHYAFGNGWDFTLGEDFYICGEFQVPTNWVAYLAARTIQDFFVIEQSNQFPTGNQPGQFVLGQPDRIELHLNAGHSADGGLNFDVANNQNLVPLNELDTDPTWHQYVRRVKLATDSTGMWEGWWRRRGETSWTKTVEYNGHPTVYWFGSGSPDPTLTMRDTIDAYTRGSSTIGGRAILHHRYARSINGPGVLVDFLNS